MEGRLDGSGSAGSGLGDWLDKSDTVRAVWQAAWSDRLNVRSGLVGTGLVGPI